MLVGLFDECAECVSNETQKAYKSVPGRFFQQQNDTALVDS